MLYWITSEVNMMYNNSTRQKPHALGMLNEKRKKIFTIGDSHAWSCAIKIANLMGKSYEVPRTQCLETEMKPLHHWLIKRLAT